MTSTSSAPAPAAHPHRIDLPAQDSLLRQVSPEELNRVTDTAANLVVQGRRVTVRQLASLTGIEPAGVEAAVAELVTRGLLRPAGAAPHHYVFTPGRWPVARG
jgi:hypothetical protein